MFTSRTQVRAVGDKIDQALAALGKELGLHFRAGRARYDRDGRFCTYQLEASVINDDGEVESPHAVAFKQQAKFLGFEPDDLGREFPDFDGAVFRITGLNVKAVKNKIMVDRVSTGKGYVMPVARVRAGLGR